MQMKSRLTTAALASAIAMAGTPPAMAASHSDAPLIKQDPQANITDVYAFMGTRYDNPHEAMLNVIVQVRPFSEPGDGVIYDRFADDALYSIHITDPNTGETQLRYDFRFSQVSADQSRSGAGGQYKNHSTILSYGLGTEIGPINDVGDNRQNYVQTYSVYRTDADRHHWAKRPRRIGKDLLTPPPNVGLNTTPAYNDPASGRAVSGAMEFSQLDSYTQQTVHDLSNGEVVFAGPREDGFFADTPAIFDLLDARIVDNNGDLGDGLGQDGNGVDGFKGYNVLAYGIQIPLHKLNPTSFTAPFADLGNTNNPLPSVAQATGVGVYASVSRPRVTLRSRKGTKNGGGWVQVNRMGNPLFNEVLVALEDKDTYNRAEPAKDGKFSDYAENPEIASLLNQVFGLNLADSGRDDLALVYLPDVLRVDTTTDPVTLAGQTSFNRLGFIGGDTTTAADGKVKSGGWPNGRRLGDDVIDIALTAVASGPSYSPVNLVGDNIARNDQDYHQVFPYAATPHAGPTNRKDL